MPHPRRPGRILKVALDIPVRQVFDYLAQPEPPSGPMSAETAAQVPEPRAGIRVRVPFGRRRLVGIVVETAVQSGVPSERLKTALAALDTDPLLDEPTLGLIRWAADYYHHPIGQAIAAALPRALRLGACARPTQTLWIATSAGIEALARGEPKRAAGQRRLLSLLAGENGAHAAALDAALGNWRDGARALARRGWIARHVRELDSAQDASRVLAPAAPQALGPAPTLTADQEVAVEAICGSLGRFAAWVLHGITGSGKTEVYLRTVEDALRGGRRALVLVPEIGLTPQLVARFRERLGAPLAVLHSALTDGERLAAWREAASGRARVVIGTRSAVFAPVPELGLIVVDEEHDSSYKQHDGGFHYSARDVAVMRARRAGVPVVLGSATPAFETLHNAAARRYGVLSLPRRAAQSSPPRISLVDLRAHPAHSGLSAPVLQAIERHLGNAGQVLVYLNRRGYAPTLLCTACGWIAPCRDCDARLTVHRAAQRLRCHHCGAESSLPEHCPQCGFAVKPVGQGTERIAERLAELFGADSLVRLDRDVVRRRGDMETAMARVASGAGRVLVGTQMVTKGHDFPNMTLVAVLNADQGLFSTDFRAPERLAQTIVQVAGRAGRGTKPGEVLVQTEYPEHPLLASLLADGYEGFARTALAERAAAAWPPFSRLAAVRDSAPTPEAALAFLVEARRAAGRPAGLRLLGPAPAAMAKRAGRYHAQLLVESDDRGALHGFLDGWIPRLEALPAARRVRWALDVDPIELF